MVAPKRLPRVYCVRHGPTEWSINGRHVSGRTDNQPGGFLDAQRTYLPVFIPWRTGTTDLPLTEGGEKIVADSSARLVGPNKILDPQLLTKILISPRQRAKRTFELLFGESLPAFEIEENVREWTYGDYEGLWKHEVAEIRKQKGLPSGRGGWDIWVDGCEGGESPEEITARVDCVVRKVKDLHRAWVEDPDRKAEDKGGDVLIVTHGHFSRCFVARWLGLPLPHGGLFTVETGSVTIGQYYGASLDFPILGGLNIGCV
ncbi:hypothetical protein MJO28_011831 [Puccinia striiformis f. sp. tritici]|uniref:Uncharacterized protein n=1 Tax=Puccinia striiformis f. sp. tritici TaxID=168172 RepID=A0ACC0E6A7_9BASI|nr:hypothetical protein MJO28_011831 [Puccinia striiformis f. sp. tritici]